MNEIERNVAAALKDLGSRAPTGGGDPELLPFPDSPMPDRRGPTRRVLVAASLTALLGLGAVAALSPGGSVQGDVASGGGGAQGPSGSIATVDVLAPDTTIDLVSGGRLSPPQGSMTPDQAEQIASSFGRRVSASEDESAVVLFGSYGDVTANLDAKDTSLQVGPQRDVFVILRWNVADGPSKPGVTPIPYYVETVLEVDGAGASAHRQPMDMPQAWLESERSYVSEELLRQNSTVVYTER